MRSKSVAEKKEEKYLAMTAIDLSRLCGASQKSLLGRLMYLSGVRLRDNRMLTDITAVSNTAPAYTVKKTTLLDQPLGLPHLSKWDATLSGTRG